MFVSRLNAVFMSRLNAVLKSRPNAVFMSRLNAVFMSRLNAVFKSRLNAVFMSPQRELGGAQALAHPADPGTLAKLFRLFRPWGWHSSVSMYHLWWRHVGWNDSPTTTCITARYCA